MKWLVDPKKNGLATQHMKSFSERLATQHMKSFSERLRSYDLRYDNLFDPYYDVDIKLSRLPREVVDARNQRLKRAMNLSMKHEYLPGHIQVMQTPLSYQQDMLALVKREMLNVTLWEPYSSISAPFLELITTSTAAASN
ncbi:cytochrome bd ubiquinol oxidase, 14kDa subunit [Actinidia rufa]|uniref:Cytochrome bd ubiquinol oxidase, 14kDa subunit n=1 Tax=Actinidia rufa TaxID=165716 RepID=A0A7J0FE08_9ERIC|nr:cytochrome bd ubiquinol oxidase, 14kDa subunit [Actinidia rufa]